jgi:lysophospholipase L1-like esterase
LLLAAALSAAASGCAHANAPYVHDTAAHHSIVVLGDSLAQGYGASDPGRGFTFLIYRRIALYDPTAQITNFAIAGSKAGDVIAAELPTAQAASATDVWLCVGANDVTHGTPQEQYATQMRQLVTAVKQRWPSAQVVVFGVPDVSQSPLFTGMARFLVHRLARADNDAAAEAARAGGASFVDLFAFSHRAFDVRRELGADNFHPNDEGYQAIAQFAQHSLGLR